MKIIFIVTDYLMNISFKFHDDPRFRWGYIWLLVTHVCCITWNYRSEKIAHFWAHGVHPKFFFQRVPFAWVGPDGWIFRNNWEKWVLMITIKIRAKMHTPDWGHSEEKFGAYWVFKPYIYGPICYNSTFWSKVADNSKFLFHYHF